MTRCSAGRDSCHAQMLHTCPLGKDTPLASSAHKCNAVRRPACLRAPRAFTAVGPSLHLRSAVAAASNRPSFYFSFFFNACVKAQPVPAQATCHQGTLRCTDSKATVHASPKHNQAPFNCSGRMLPRAVRMLLTYASVTADRWSTNLTSLTSRLLNNTHSQNPFDPPPASSHSNIARRSLS